MAYEGFDMTSRDEVPVDVCRRLSFASKPEWASVENKFWDRKLDPVASKEALFIVDDCLKHFKLHFWLCFGTALGFYRDRNFIPWDDDIDIQVIADEFEGKMDDVQEYLIKQGCVVRSVKRSSNSKMSIFVNGIKLQIQGINETPDLPNMVQMKLFKYPKKFYYETYQNITFADREFCLPGPPDEYLTFCYGKDWNTPQNIPDWRDYMAPEQLKDNHWLAAHRTHNERKGKK